MVLTFFLYYDQSRTKRSFSINPRCPRYMRVVRRRSCFHPRFIFLQTRQNEDITNFTVKIGRGKASGRAPLYLFEDLLSRSDWDRFRSCFRSRASFMRWASSFAYSAASSRFLTARRRFRTMRRRFRCSDTGVMRRWIFGALERAFLSAAEMEHLTSDSEQ